MNRHRFVPLALLLVFCVLLSSPAITSTSQSVLQNVGPLLTERNWNSADLPEDAVVYNNLEDFIDQLSDLHNESDIGTHSNPTTLQVLDGVYDSLTSANVTIPGRWIEDPLNETPPYWRPAYESWRLDLEGGWIDVDYDEVKAELCVYGGTQAEEALRVDIWDNDGWINVIPDIMPGWNNVSIAPSIVDESLEIRFTGSDTGNTSISGSWEIDAVLLHTWTVMYGSKLTQNGIIQDLGNNLSRYIGSVGEMNTWDDTSDTWYRYLYDPEEKTVQIGNLTITHLPGGDLSIDGDAGSRVGKLSWFIQAYYNDQWNNITLDNYEFAGFTKTADNITAHQRFWGTQGEMNVYLTYSYFGGFKTRVDIRNDAAQAVPIRAIWAARDVSGIQDNYELLRNEDDIVYGIQIEDAVFSWNDVIASDNPLPTQTVIDKPTRRAAVIFGNQSTIIPAGYTATIDPDYSMTSDAYDNYWNYWTDPTDTDVDNADANKIETDGSSFTYASLFAAPVDIVPYSVVTAATLTVYVISESGANTVNIQRIDSSNVPALDDNVNGNGGSPPTIDTSPVGTLLIGATGPITSQDIGKLVQESINEAGWAANNRMGFRLMPDAVCAHTIEDYQRATSNHAKITITYVAPSANWLAGYGYRQGHSIDGKTGAGTNYQVEVAVEYGAGTSADGTIYANENCDTDFDDIRFTDGDGQTELDYWMEEKTDSDDATFWVEVTDDLGSDQVIYCYYGKSGDSTTSDGDATFLWFDNFNGASLDTDKWTLVQGAVTFASGHLVLTATDATRAIIECDTTFSYNTMITVGGAYASMDRPYPTRWLASYSSTVQFTDRMDMFQYGGADAVRAYVGNDGTNSYQDGSVDDLTAATNYYLSYTSSDVVYIEDGGTILSFNTNIPDDAMTQLFYEGTLSSGAHTAHVNWTYGRKYVTAEPAHYTWTVEHEPPTYAPINDVAPECTNMDDGDNLYAGYKTYLFTANVSDANGYDDIEFVQLFSYDYAEVTERWMVQYLESDNSFAESDSGGNIELVTGSCAYSKSGIDIDITFAIKVEWKSAYYTNLDDDLRQLVKDDSALTDDDNYDSNYNYIARVSMTGETLSDGSGTVDRGNYDTVGDITASGTIVYYDSAACRPPTDEIDVWVTCPDTPDPDWQATNYEASGGTFSVAVDSDNVVGLDTYTFKVVTQGSGSGGADYTYETNEATYIADQIMIQTTVSSDAQDRLDIDGSVEIRVTASLAYTIGGTVWLGAGDTITLDGVSMSWDAGNSWFELSRSQASVGKWNYYVNSSSETGHGVTKLDLNGQNVDVIWDRAVFTFEVNMTWTIVGYYANVSWAAIYDFDDTEYLGTEVVNNDGGVLTFNTVANHTFYVTSIDDGAGYDLTEFTTNTVWCVWDDVVPSGSVSYYWTEPASPNLDSVNLIWGAGSNWMWDYNDTLLNIAVIFTSYSNGSAPSGSGGTYGSGAFGGLTTGLYSGTVWDYIDFTVDASVTIDNVDYEWEIWSVGMAVVVPHSLTTSVWFFYKDGDYYQLLMHTNYENASVMVWDDMEVGGGYDDSIYYGDYEGMHEWLRDTTVGTHNCTILLNAGADKGTVARNYVANDLRLWYNFTYAVAEPLAYDCHIVILDSLYNLIPFDTFEVYKNGTRIYHDIIRVTDGYGYQIEVKNRYGDTVNSTAFSADREMVIFVNVYSLKFWSAYEGFCVLTISRGGVDYSEVLMPMEIVNFRLYSASYDYSIDYLDDTIMSGNINLVESTGVVITNDTISDIFGLIEAVWDMSDAINVTVNTVADNTYLIQLMFDWTNTTLYNQSITILASFNWENTTLYNQTISLLNAFNATNTVIYNQIVLIQNMFNWENTTLFNQTISILNAFNATNTVIYEQTISILSEISSMNATIYGQTVSLLNYLYFNSSSIYNQTIDILTQLSLIGSNITANYISLGASLVAIDSSLLANFTSVSATLLAIDSSLLSNFTSVTADLVLINSALASNFTAVVATLSAIGSNITANYLSIAATLSMIDSSLLNNFTSVTATLSAIGTNITANYLLVSATLSMIDSALLSNFTELTAELLAVNSTIGSQFLSVSATLSMLDSSLLSNFTSVSATLLMIDSALLSNFTSVTATLSAIGSNVTSNYLSVAATLSMIDSSLLSNFTAITSTLTTIGSNITTNYLAVSATLSMLDSSLLSNFTEISATLLMIDSSMLSNFTSVTSTLAALGSNVTSNYLSVAAALVLIDSNLYSNFTSITSTLTAMGSNITTNYLAITAELALIDSSLAANFTTMMTKLIATNSSLFIQTLAIISDLEFLNATMYLVDDPTHLNPLVLGHSYSDVYCDLTIVTNWHNASISVYDNDLLRTGPTSELLCPIRYPLLATSGTHNLSIFVDGSNDSFWYNISYTVAEITAFELEDWDVTPHLGVENHLECIFRTTWGNSTIYVYLNDSLQTSVLEQEGGISFSFWMTGTPGLHEYVFNVTSGTNVITITWDFYLPDWADTGLVVRWDMWTFQNNYTLITLESNWMNCTYYLYLNDSLVATSYNDPVTLNFTRDMNEGTYNLTIHAYGGSQNYTVKNIRYIVTEEGVSYDFSTVTGGVTYAYGDTYEGDVTIHENPPGWFMDQGTAAIIAVGSFLVIFTAFLVARELKQRDRENREAQYSQ